MSAGKQPGQRLIFKIHSSRLAKAGWDLRLTLAEARKNDELIGIADSQVFRWIDELNGTGDTDAGMDALKAEIAALKKDPSVPDRKKKIRQLFRRIEKLQFKPDYMCLVIDHRKEYWRAVQGFTVNGRKFHRLLGTAGGIKNSTIVFVSDKLWPEIQKRIDNGRNMEKPLVTAKLEAYKALTCSASVPVSFPKGVLVVPDAETEFLSDVVLLSDGAESDEPDMKYAAGYHVKNDASDGCGLILPSLADRWAQDLGLWYTPSCFNTRMSFEKGIVAVFDFLEFAEKEAHEWYVTDAWGDEVDIRSVDLILTTSMLKLWDSYPSCEAYMDACLENRYTFAVTKTAPEQLESERCTNYQFIQSFDLGDGDIDALVSPTLEEFKDVLGGDWRKAALFLNGKGMDDRSVRRMPPGYAKAMLIEPAVMDDPYVKDEVYKLVRYRIKDAKIGVIKVHGNYSIVTGDPFLLCQSLFGMEKTGLLKAGEVYSQYWADRGAGDLVCFRAPMSCHESVRSIKSVDNEDVRHWYRYLHTCTVLNGFDDTPAALNGMDYDGDIIMITDNKVLVGKHKPLPALMCLQSTAAKTVPAEEDFIQSNINGFGNEIGKITNRITSMYEVRTKFDEDSREYKELTYRIQCGQLQQQNTIDKIKGIKSKPMPKTWYDRHAILDIEDEDRQSFYDSIVADKKPYFMTYIYPSLRKDYKRYHDAVSTRCRIDFGLTIDELEKLDDASLTEEMRGVLAFYHDRMPVGTAPCLMNKICWKFEDAFDQRTVRNTGSGSFDYRMLKSDAEYSMDDYYRISALMKEYNKTVKDIAVMASVEKVSMDDIGYMTRSVERDFRAACTAACPDERQLCNIVLDLCYTKSTTKRFAWEMCGDVICRNLLEKNGGKMRYPARDSSGDLLYGGDRFSVKELDVEDTDDSIERARMGEEDDQQPYAWEESI